MKNLIAVFALTLACFPAFSQTAVNLQDLEKMTWACPSAALNAAAREAAKAPTNGHYQFSSFKIVLDSSAAQYEVGFKSNFSGEPDLNYDVNLYCQQGWDPNSTVSITLEK